MKETRILIVEDNILVTMQLKLIFKKLGYQVVDHVNSGEEAIKVALESHPDLIMMDISLEGKIDGIETANLIRKKVNIPVVYITGYADSKTLGRAKLTNPFGYVIKPFNEESIRSAIEIAMYKYQLDKEIQANEEFVKSITNAVPEVLIIFDIQKNKIIYANNALFHILGFHSDEILNYSPTDFFKKLIDENTEINSLLNYNLWLHKKDIYEEEFKVLKKDKSPIWINCRMVVFKNDPDGVPSQMLWIISDITEKKLTELKIAEIEKVQSEQKDRIQKIKALSIIEGQEKERKRISKDIHDGLGQLLTGIKLNLSAISSQTDLKEDTYDILSHTRKLLNDAISEVRRISYDLLPTTLHDFGLAPAIKHLVENITKTDKFSISFDHNLKDERFNDQVEVSIYRVVQEALNNSAKHASASQIQVRIFKEDNIILLEINDNGKGFLVKTAPYMIPYKSMGIINMKERVELLGGKFEIRSIAGKGSKILVRIPLKLP